jgi:outer membrane protein TolC
MIPFLTPPRLASFLLPAALTAFLCLNACAVDQKSEVQTYRKIIDEPHPKSTAVQPNQVLTLTQALRLANENDEQLSIQGETYLQALIAKDQAFSAFLPTVNFVPAYSFATRSGGVSTGTGGVITGGGTTHNFAAPIEGQINLFNGFRDYHALKSADATIEQKKQLVLDLQQTVLLDVEQTYYQILTSEQSVDVFLAAMKTQQVNVDYITREEKVGLAIPLDLAQAQAQLAQTQVSLDQARADVRNGRAMLAYLCNAPIEFSPLRDDFAPPSEVPALSSWYAQAEAARQDLLAANAAVVAAREQVEVAFGQYYPSVTFNLNYELYNESLGGSGGLNGVLGLDLPIFTGGLIQAEVRQAWSEFRQAALTQAALRRQIDQTVETAWINLQLAHRELADLGIQVRAARDALYLAQKNYQTGRGTLLNALIAEDTLLSTQLQLTSEQFTQKTAYFNLLRAAGKLAIVIGQPATQPSDEQIRRWATEPVTRPTTR